MGVVIERCLRKVHLLCMIHFFPYACYIWFILRYFWGLLLWTKEVFILIDQDEKVPPIVCAIFFRSHLNDLVVSCYWAVYWCNCRVVELRHVCLRYKNKASQDIEMRKIVWVWFFYPQTSSQLGLFCWYNWTTQMSSCLFMNNKNNFHAHIDRWIKVPLHI